MRNEKLTIMDLPKTKKQIELNNRLSSRIARGWKNILNDFFQPKEKFTQRESILIAIVGLSLVITVVTLLMMFPTPFGD